MGSQSRNLEKLIVLTRRPFTQPARPERPPMAWPGVQTFAPATRCDGLVVAQPKREYVRSKPLLSAVRTLPCQHCTWPVGIQASHSNAGADGKGRGIKADDNCIAALCRDCHHTIDQGSKLSKAERQAMWQAAHIKTVKALLSAGLWPMDVPIPDIRSFQA